MYNLTKPQQLIYDMEKYAGGSMATICGSILLKGKKNEAALADTVNQMYRLNDALRIRIVERDGVPMQYALPYEKQEIEVLRFQSKAELDAYAESYAKEPMDFYGSLCHIRIVILEDSFGILAKTHHIISDAWTLALVGSQFCALVNGEIPETYSYFDFVQAVKAYSESARRDTDRAYFEEQFEKCDEATYLSDKSIKGYAASRKTIVVPQDKVGLISDYAAEHNASVFMLLMSSFGAYFSRIKMNTEKLYVGTAILNRFGREQRSTMGMFVNTAPVLLEIGNDNTFADNLSSVSLKVMQIIRHQKFNYGEILKDLRSRHGFSEKLYDVLLSYQNAKVTGMTGDFESTWYPCGMQTESLQIHIEDRDSEGILKIHYDYQTEKFSKHDIEKLHEHWFNLLLDAISDDSKKISKLELLSEEEKNTLLYRFNNTFAEYVKDKCIHQLFEEQVLKTPDKTAIIACDKTLTYDELNRLANRIAHGLIAKGVKPNDIVAFALPRNSFLIPVMFGILKSGAAYMPIDPDYPRDRIEYMLDDSKAKEFITESDLNEYLSDDETNPTVSVTQNDYYCALHTSGSTGTPKMSLLKHGEIMSFIAANQCFWHGVDAVVSTTIVTFDAFQMDSILSIAQGFKLVLASEQEMYGQTDFESLFGYSEKNMFFSTPTKLQSYIQNSDGKQFLKRIKTFIVGGEVFSKELLDLIGRYTEESSVYNIYGPTETTICTAVDKLEFGKDITIGKPIANTQIYILDKYGNPTPIGVTGELCIAGDGVGAGYLNRPELTAEKFVDNPFGEGKMYKTGDLAYWREDGNIVYVGRNDFQVKIRGLRIELGEIENAISSVEGVSQAVVVVRKDESGRQLICAFYTEKENVKLSDIKAAISAKLPKYMMPHIFTVLEEMPLTSSGKINRKALPEVNLANFTSDAEYVAPTTDKEKALVSEIEAVLNAEKVGILDNFFDLGGDSLKAIELISKLEAKGYKTTVKAVFDSDTVKDLAEKLEQTEPETEIIEWTGDVPATDAQMRVYTAQSMHEDSTMYNVPYVFKAKAVDIEKLQKAIDEMLCRHEILRTRFENKDGTIIQIADEKAKCTVERLASDDILAFVRPFDLSKAPLIRVGVYENTVMIDMHHIITDGSSMPVFFRELNELYMGRTMENVVIQYKNIAFQGQNDLESEKYWLSVFNDEIPVLEINTDFPRGQKLSYNGKAYYDFIDIDLHNKIKERCKELGITPYVFYMGAFNILLSKFSGNEDIVVGMPVSGRNGKNLNTIGMFVNTVALRNQPVGTKTVSEFLREVKDNSVSAIAHQNYPFGRLVKKLNIESENRHPLFDVMFAYQSEELTDIVFGDEKAVLLPIPVTTSKYDFTLNVMPRENDVALMAEYCTDLYKENIIKRMIEGYKNILNQICNKNN